MPLYLVKEQINTLGLILWTWGGVREAPRNLLMGSDGHILAYACPYSKNRDAGSASILSLKKCC